MPSFRYTARTPEGETQTGIVEASSRDAAVAILQQHHLIITGLTAMREEGLGALLRERPLMFLGRISRKDVVMFSRQLSVLFEANVPLLEAFNAIIEQTENPRFARALRAVASDIDAGTALSDAIGKHPKAFGPFYVNMVKFGEASGKLEEAFAYLADYLEREYAIVAKIRGAFLYPSFVVVVLGGIAAFMVFRVLPEITGIFEEEGAVLPLPTRMILSSVAFLRWSWWFLLGGAALLVAAFVRLTATPDGRAWRDAQVLRLPVLGNVVRSLLIARFADSLGTLIAAGIPIIRALEVTSDVVGNAVFRGVLAKAIEGVQRGEPLHEAVASSRAFPATVVQMVAVGERTGKLEQVLSHVARFYQRDAETKTASLVALIEPMLIILVGLGVGLFVAAILLPVYSLSMQ